jgi:hypothetical protein
MQTTILRHDGRKGRLGHHRYGLVLAFRSLPRKVG